MLAASANLHLCPTTGFGLVLPDMPMPNYGPMHIFYYFLQGLIPGSIPLFFYFVVTGGLGRVRIEI